MATPEQVFHQAKAAGGAIIAEARPDEVVLLHAWEANQARLGPVPPFTAERAEALGHREALRGVLGRNPDARIEFLKHHTRGVRFVSAVALAAVACLAGCGDGGATTTGSGGSASSTASSTTSTTGTGGSASWHDGLSACTVEEPVVAGEQGAPDIVFLRLRPAGRHVEKVGTAVTRGMSGPAGATGGPYVIVWATGLADGSLPAAPRVWEETSVEETAVKWVSPSIGFTDTLITPWDLHDDETLWVGGRLDPHAPAPSSVLLCESADLAADTFGASGACPGTDCVVAPLPAPWSAYSALSIADGH